MAARPTCKVVLREKQGTDKGGARIYPKGCKVRTEIKPGNQVIKKDKAGRQKYKTKTQDRDSFIRAARAPGTLLAHTVRLLYDTGAQVTTMPQANATKLGYPPAYVQLHGVPGAMSGVVPTVLAHLLALLVDKGARILGVLLPCLDDQRNGASVVHDWFGAIE
jgi:hypothetical protein